MDAEEKPYLHFPAILCVLRVVRLAVAEFSGSPWQRLIES